MNLRISDFGFRISDFGHFAGFMALCAVEKPWRLSMNLVSRREPALISLGDGACW